VLLSLEDIFIHFLLYYRITFTNGQKIKNTDVFLVPEKVILSSKSNAICSYMMYMKEQVLEVGCNKW